LPLGTIIGKSRPSQPLDTIRPGTLCLVAAVTTRVLVFLAGYAAVTTVGYPHSPTPPPVTSNRFLDLPARWDSGWYVGIASGGYRWTPEHPPYERLKFFPAYPLLLRAIAGPINPARNVVVWLWTGVVLSSALFWLALLALFRLTEKLCDRETASRVVWITACYPFAIFFGLPYTESLFLLAIVSALLATEDSRWAYAVAWGLLAGLTRPTGFLLAPAIALVAWQRTRRLQAGWIAAAASPLAGTALYSGYLFLSTGHALAWVTGQPGGSGAVNPFSQAFSMYDAVNAAAFLVATGGAIVAAGRLGAGYALLVLLTIGMALFGVGVNCMGRYTSVLFPIAVSIALFARRASFMAWIAASLVLECAAAAAFFTWRPLY
jgi:hypothetical protein